MQSSMFFAFLFGYLICESHSKSKAGNNTTIKMYAHTNEYLIWQVNIQLIQTHGFEIGK